MASTDPATINKYRLGFNECASEVSKFLGTMNGIDTDIRSRLLNHLANCTVNPDPEVPETNVANEQRKPSPVLHQSSAIERVRLVNTRSILTGNSQTVINPGFVYGKNNNLQPLSTSPQATSTKIEKPVPIISNVQSPSKSVSSLSQSETQSVQVAKVFSGFQAIPTKMASGEMAFIIPAGNVMSCNTIPNYVIPVIQPQPSLQINTQTATSQTSIQNISPVQIAYSMSGISNPIPAQSVISSPTNVDNISRPITLQQPFISMCQPTSVMQPEVSRITSLPIFSSSAFSSINAIKEEASPSPTDRASQSTSNVSNAASTAASAHASTSNSPREEDKLDPMWRPWWHVAFDYMYVFPSYNTHKYRIFKFDVIIDIDGVGLHIKADRHSCKYQTIRGEYRASLVVPYVELLILTWLFFFSSSYTLHIKTVFE